MSSDPTVLVVCTANVCRSPYAANLLRPLLSPHGIQVRSAGLAATPGQPPCPLVASRLAETQERSFSHTSRQLSPEALRANPLVLTMTTAQRGEVNRLWWGRQERVFTLVEAVAITRTVSGPIDFEEYVAALSERRSRVPMPVATHMSFPWLWRTEEDIEVDIADGHTSRRTKDHLQTLEQVERESLCLAEAMVGLLRSP